MVWTVRRHCPFACRGPASSLPGGRRAEDALGDTKLLPAGVRAVFDDLLHRLRTGRER